MDKVNNKLYNRIAKLESKNTRQSYAIYILVLMCILSMSVNITLATESYASGQIIDDIMSTDDRSEDQDTLTKTEPIIKLKPTDGDGVELFSDTKIGEQFDLPIYKSSERTTYSDWLKQLETRPEAKLTSNTEKETKPEEPEPVSEPQFPETELTGNANLDRDVLTKVISEVAPALAGIEDALLHNYNTHGIKPSFSLAVACLESGYGKSDLAKYKNNLYGMNAYPYNGLTAYQHAFTYNSKSDSVIDFGDKIYSQYMLKGLTTLESINRIYCPPNPQWASHVRSIKNKIENIYDEYSTV